MNLPKLKTLLQGIYVVWFRDLLGFLRDKARLLGAFIPNLIILVGLGFGLGSALGSIGGSSGLPGVTYAQFIFPMILCSTAMMVAIQSTMSIVYDREFGFMRKILVAPISRISVVLGKVLSGIMIALIQTVLFLVVAPLTGIHLTVGTFTMALLLLILISAVVTAIGILAAARQKSTQGFQMISMFVFVPLMLLTFGSALPSIGTGRVGAILKTVEWLNPVAYGVDALRQILLGGILPHTLTMLPPMIDVTILIIGFIVLIIPGVALFNKQD